MKKLVGLLIIFSAMDVSQCFARELKIGDSYQGGIVAYILQAEDIGYSANVQHGLIVATSDCSNDGILFDGAQWYNGWYVRTGATGTSIGKGKANTDLIVKSQGDGDYAARLCYDLETGGYKDWYLPSLDELKKVYLLYSNTNAIGGFRGHYWSSSESGLFTAWYLYFRDGTPNNDVSKSDHNNVRCVRSF